MFDLTAILDARHELDPVANYYAMFPQEVTAGGDVNPIARIERVEGLTFHSLVMKMTEFARKGTKQFLLVEHGYWDENNLTGPPIGLFYPLADGTKRGTGRDSLPVLRRMMDWEDKLDEASRSSGIGKETLQKLFDAGLRDTLVSIKRTADDMARIAAKYPNFGAPAFQQLLIQLGQPGINDARLDQIASKTGISKADLVLLVGDIKQADKDEAELNQIAQTLNVAKKVLKSKPLSDALDTLRDRDAELSRLAQAAGVSLATFERVHASLEQLRSLQLVWVDIRACSIGTDLDLLEMFGVLLGTLSITAPLGHSYYVPVNLSTAATLRDYEDWRGRNEFPHSFRDVTRTRRFALRLRSLDTTRSDADGAALDTSPRAQAGAADLSWWVEKFLMAGAHHYQPGGPCHVEAIGEPGTDEWPAPPYCLPLDPRYHTYLAQVRIVWK